jgi:hypothetical protein
MQLSGMHECMQPERMGCADMVHVMEMGRGLSDNRCDPSSEARDRNLYEETTSISLNMHDCNQLSRF